jgi:hypothetical protein
VHISVLILFLPPAPYLFDLHLFLLAAPPYLFGLRLFLLAAAP